MPHKFFTLADANRTLPLVKRIVQDIMSVYPRWKDLVAQYELIAAQARPDWGESQEQIALKAQIDTVAAKINGFLGELEEIGCEFKGFDLGLVDFHGRLSSVKSCGAGSSAKTGLRTGMSWRRDSRAASRCPKS